MHVVAYAVVNGEIKREPGVSREERAALGVWGEPGCRGPLKEAIPVEMT